MTEPWRAAKKRCVAITMVPSRRHLRYDAAIVASPDFLLVWDLDHTLGVFDALADMRDDAQPVTIRLRQGIDEALTQLSAEGFAHTVLTLASPSYAQLALRGSGLQHHFLEIAAAGQRPKGDVKGLASKFDIPHDECPSRMLFIGDHSVYDPPLDPRVVFHLEPHALRRPAGPVTALLLALREAGNGSLRLGFDAIASRGGDELVKRCELDGVGSLLLLARNDGCPVVVFNDEGLDEEDLSTPVTFVPAQQLRR